MDNSAASISYLMPFTHHIKSKFRIAHDEIPGGYELNIIAQVGDIKLVHSNRVGRRYVMRKIFASFNQNCLDFI